MKAIRTVVITGASSGIGKACALCLNRTGFRVFAGVRKQTQADALRLEASERLIPVFLDVTNDDSIAAAVQTVAVAAGGKLFGLVNNAGIGVGGPLEMVPLGITRKVIEVNVFGLHAVTQAFLPLLRQGKGRIVNIGSKAGFLATPGASGYAASKFAVEAITDALRVELRPFGIFVTIVSPGSVNSALREKVKVQMMEMYKATRPELLSLYAPLIEHTKNMLDRPKALTAADEVAEAVTRAFTARKPLPRYVVGRDAKIASCLAWLPRRFLAWLLFRKTYGRRR